MCDKEIKEKVLEIIQSIKDKDLAVMIQSHINEPTESKLLSIMSKLGIKVVDAHLTISNVTCWYEIDDNNEKETHLQLGGIIVDGLLFVLEIIYSHHDKVATIELHQKVSAILQLIDMVDQNLNK